LGLKLGLFGTGADVLVDVNLILQYVTLVLLVIGYVKRRPFKTHGRIMTTVLTITLATTVLVMAPRLNLVYRVNGLGILVHALGGLATLALGGLFVYRFISALQKGKPLLCGTKNMMRLVLILWVIIVLGGTAVYFTLYL